MNRVIPQLRQMRHRAVSPGGEYAGALLYFR